MEISIKSDCIELEISGTEYGMLVLLLVVYLLPIPRKIDGSFPCMNQDGKDTIVTVKGTY